MDIKEIQNLIKFVAKSGASEVSLEMDDVKITIKTGDEKSAVEQTTILQQVPQVVAQPAIQATPLAAPAAAEAPVAETPGQQIKEGDVLCVIEAMKLFNEIESEISGKIVKVLVDDSSPVEFDQPLFLVDPS